MNMKTNQSISIPGVKTQDDVKTYYWSIVYGSLAMRLDEKSDFGVERKTKDGRIIKELYARSISGYLNLIRIVDSKFGPRLNIRLEVEDDGKVVYHVISVDMNLSAAKIINKLYSADPNKPVTFSVFKNNKGMEVISIKQECDSGELEELKPGLFSYEDGKEVLLVKGIRPFPENYKDLPDLNKKAAIMNRVVDTVNFIPEIMNRVSDATAKRVASNAIPGVAQLEPEPIADNAPAVDLSVDKTDISDLLNGDNFGSLSF